MEIPQATAITNGNGPKPLVEDVNNVKIQLSTAGKVKKKRKKRRKNLYMIYKGKSKCKKGDACKCHMSVKVINGSRGRRYVRKSRSDNGLKNKWATAFKEARKSLKITGFVPIRKTMSKPEHEAGYNLYKETLKRYKTM